MQKYIDSHSHLFINQSFDDLFADANKIGVVGCSLNSVSESDWATVIDIANKNKNISAGLGIHPFVVDHVSAGWYKNMDLLLNYNPDLILGEIGLDKTKDNFSTQEKIFTQQLELAIKHNRTINLHCVHAWDVLLQIFKTYRNKLPKIVVHSFDGTENVINFDADMYFSYSPNILDSKYKKVIASIPLVPKDKILIESDCAEFDVVPKVANAVANARPDITSDDIFNNSKRVFFNG